LLGRWKEGHFVAVDRFAVKFVVENGVVEAGGAIEVNDRDFELRGGVHGRFGIRATAEEQKKRDGAAGGVGSHVPFSSRE